MATHNRGIISQELIFHSLRPWRPEGFPGFEHSFTGGELGDLAGHCSRIPRPSLESDEVCREPHLTPGGDPEDSDENTEALALLRHPVNRRAMPFRATEKHGHVGQVIGYAVGNECQR